MNTIDEFIKTHPHLKDKIRYSREERVLYLRAVISDEDMRKLTRIAKDNFFIQPAML